MFVAEEIAIESEYEDDGLYMITIWTDDEIGYMAIYKDLQESNPEKIYFEWSDQVNRRFVEGFSFSVDRGILKINFNDMSIPDNLLKLEVNISNFDDNAVVDVLNKIINS